MTNRTNRYEVRELPTGRFQTWDRERETYTRTGVSQGEAQRIADRANAKGGKR